VGKKRIIKQTEEQAVKEAESVSVQSEKAFKKATGGFVAHARGIRGAAYIHASYNNTIITMTDSAGNVIAWASAGSAGFKGAKKSTPFAASRVAEILVEKITKSGIKEIDVFVRGVGSGRDSAIRSLSSHGLDILSIEDVTPLPHNGCRPKKPRRV
jgi:small subunit ribosomal protein S11